MRSSNFTRVLGILFVAAIVGALIGWWASRNPSRPERPATEVASQVNSPTRDSEPVPVPSTSNEVAVVIPPREIVSTNLSEDAETWEDKLDQILGSDTDTDKKGQDLLDLLPTVDEDAQMELAGHIVNLVDDAHYARVAPYLTNAAVPEAVSSVFMSDLYNRENSLKLPLVLAVARNEKHPLRDEARDLLELYLEEDHGADWNKWESAMNTWLKENPDDGQ